MGDEDEIDNMQAAKADMQKELEAIRVKIETEKGRIDTELASSAIFPRWGVVMTIFHSVDSV